MAWKNWDKHTASVAIRFAREYSKNTPEDKASLLDVVLYVHSALSKKGINKSKEDIKNLLLNPPSYPLLSSKDSPKLTSSDGKCESNCKRTEKLPQQPITPLPNTQIIDGGVKNTKLSSSQSQKQSENQADTIVVLDENKQNSASSNSKTSKTETQTTIIDKNKIAIVNNTPSKVCRQDDKVLKSKQSAVAQPPVKRRTSGAPDDGVAESNCSNIGGKTLQTSVPEMNTEKVDGEITEKKCEKTAKVEIPVERTDTDLPKKQKKAENVNVIKNPERNKRNMRSSSTSDSSKTDTGILNIDYNKTSANYDIPKTDSSKTYEQGGKSLKLKRKHDAQPAVKRRKSCAADVACAQGDSPDESNCGNIGEQIRHTIALETHAENVNGDVTKKKCEEAAMEKILVEKTDTDTIITTPKKLNKSEKEVDGSKIPERNKRNMRSSSNSDNSKTDTGLLNIEVKKISAINAAPKLGSPKSCKHDGKSLKLKQKPDAQPAGKSERFDDTELDCLQGATKKTSSSKSDSKDKSNSNFTKNLHLQSSTLKSNTENAGRKVTEKKTDETNKVDILTEKSYIPVDTMIATPKKPKMSENEVDINKASDRKKINSRTSDSDSLENEDKTLNGEKNETGANYDLPKTDSPKTCKQDEKSLKLKQKHDTQPAVKRRRTCATDVSCSKGAGVDESNCSNIGAKTLGTNTENDDDVEETDKKCEEAAREEVVIEKTDTDTIIATPKKQKKSEKEVNVSKIQERSKRSMRSLSSSDSSKTDAGILNVEKNKKGTNNDVTKSGSPKTCKQDGKSLTLKQKQDAQPAVKKRRSCETNVACIQENSGMAKDTITASEKEIGSDIKTESAEVNKNNKSIPLKKDISDELNEIKIDKTSKRSKKSGGNKRTRSTSNSKNGTTLDVQICKNLEKEIGTNELPKTNSSKIVVKAVVHVPMEIKCTEKPSIPPHDGSPIDGETMKKENFANKGVADSFENHTHCDAQKPLQAAASSSSTLPREDVAVASETAKTEHIEIKTDNKLVEAVSSKIHNQSSEQKPMRTREAKKISTAPSDNITNSAETISIDNFVNEENEESVVSSKSSVQPEVERKAAGPPSTQPDGNNIIGDSAQAESVFKAVSELDELKIKPEHIKQEMIKTKKEFDTAKPKCPPGPSRKAYLRERKRKYQVKKRTELKMKQLVENPTQLGFEPGEKHHQNVYARRPLHGPFHVAATFWQQQPTCYELRPGYPQPVCSERPRPHTSWPQRLIRRQYNTRTPLRPYWQHSHTPSAQNQNLIYVKPLRRIVTKAEEPEETPPPTKASPDSGSKEEPSFTSTTEEAGEWKEAPSTPEPVPQTATDYYSSEKAGDGSLDVKDVEPPDILFKKIKLQSPTPQAPPLCSFEDVLPILGAVSSSDIKDWTDPSPNIPAAEDALPDAVCSSTLSQSSFSFTLTTEGTTETVPVSETDTVPSSQGFSNINFSPPLSPSMVYPDTPRSTKQSLDSSGDSIINNTQISEQLMNKITEQVCERVTAQVCDRVTEQVSRRVEEQLLRGLDDLKRIMLEALKSSAQK